MNDFIPTPAAPYWSELRIKLVIPASSMGKKQKMESIKKEVNAFCAQGTGFQNTIYNFIKFACKEQANQRTTTKEAYDSFINDISFICQYIDLYYLKKHPRHKKTIYSIEDLGARYWGKR